MIKDQKKLDNSLQLSSVLENSKSSDLNSQNLQKEEKTPFKAQRRICKKTKNSWKGFSVRTLNQFHILEADIQSSFFMNKQSKIMWNDLASQCVWMEKVCQQILKIREENILKSITFLYSSVFIPEYNENPLVMANLRLKNLKSMCGCLAIIGKHHSSNLQVFQILSTLTEDMISKIDIFQAQACILKATQFRLSPYYSEIALQQEDDHQQIIEEKKQKTVNRHKGRFSNSKGWNHKDKNSSNRSNETGRFIKK